MTHILAIETSCDETAAAVVVDGRQALSNRVASQIEMHRRFGGVFPEVASRQHVLAIQTVIRDALDEAGVVRVADVDAIAVTHGPGLAGSLLVGVNAAKGLAFAAGLPLIPVNHLEGHIYSNWIEAAGNPGAADDFPVLVLIVSGGHTELVLMTGHGEYRLLGSTLDDAAGEAFDKVARLLGLGYPGGPAIQKAATGVAPGRFSLPRPLMQSREHRFNFSYSGLKTAVLNLTRQLERDGIDPTDPATAAAIGAEFQAAAVEVLVEKSADAALEFGVRQVCICGGVSANRALRLAAQERFAGLGIPLRIPAFALCTDNAAMIGAAAYYRQQPRGLAAFYDLGVDVYASLPLA
ncbi:MAG: tRNA (adenosine(37)-N6)-threonylcarbamoyltransferase complex transferase subunit TsaD [Caldilineaceae bacterium]|nr:tRNA (adenosine(37)-N6)-threonylcarbamoyltransferase complex transferase subunit TsaD [Caldilineaceae bacterium]HRJ41326.1 tRNA (adenosine(37)-N6)-threonylcarbamoyltransferase complex transferase subunit TsaD [Caldilineaceae bacterium]